jgi:hypothetical protein
VNLCKDWRLTRSNAEPKETGNASQPDPDRVVLVVEDGVVVKDTTKAAA